MARLRLQRVGTTTAWAASGSISQELSPVPFTTTGLIVVCHTDITTTTATNYEDYWDRFLSRLNLTGLVNNQQKTFFDFSNLRAPMHDMRIALGPAAPPRPTVVANSQTNNLQQFYYYFHFGCQPFLPDGTFNPMDMTAGIPKVEKGQLTIGGTFGAAAALGSANVTVNATSSCYLEYYLVGVQADDGDPVELQMPRAFPVWSMRTISPTATSTTFATSDNVPAGAFLRSMLVMTTAGSTTTIRSDQILNSIRVFDQYNNREIISFGGRAGLSDAGGGDYKIAEMVTESWGRMYSAPRVDDRSGTNGVPDINHVTDQGLIHFPLYKYTTRVHPLYGADLRKLATGDIRLDYGVATATNTMDVLYKRYELNPAHPANAGIA